MDTRASVRAATGVALSDLRLGPALARLIVPTLVIAGDRDRLTPARPLAPDRRGAASIWPGCWCSSKPATWRRWSARPRSREALAGLVAQVVHAPLPREDAVEVIAR